MMNEKELNELLEMQKEVAKLSQRINSFIENNVSRTSGSASKPENDEYDEEKMVTNYLLQIGVPTNLLGFNYIRCAIVIILNSKKEKRLYVTKSLYPEVAKHFNSTEGRVERSIRHAINVLYRNNNENEFLKEMVKNTKKCCPTNSEFLAFIAEKIRLEN